MSHPLFRGLKRSVTTVPPPPLRNASISGSKARSRSDRGIVTEPLNRLAIGLCGSVVCPQVAIASGS